MRVEEPMLSMVATRRSALSRSGARRAKGAPGTFELVDFGDQASNSGVIVMVSVLIIHPIIHP